MNPPHITLHACNKTDDAVNMHGTLDGQAVIFTVLNHPRMATINAWIIDNNTIPTLLDNTPISWTLHHSIIRASEDTTGTYIPSLESELQAYLSFLGDPHRRQQYNHICTLMEQCKALYDPTINKPGYYQGFGIHHIPTNQYHPVWPNAQALQTWMGDAPILVKPYGIWNPIPSLSEAWDRILRRHNTASPCQHSQHDYIEARRWCIAHAIPSLPVLTTPTH